MDLNGLRVRLAALAALAAMCAGCPPPTVVIDGKEIPVAEAARMDFEAARRAAEAGKIEDAIRGYRAYLDKFPDAERTDDALVALGDLSFKAGRFEQARTAYQALVVDHPDSPHYVHAAVQLGLSLVRLDRAQEALPTLQSVFDRLSGSRRKAEVAGMLAESYDRAGEPVEALRWYTRLHGLTAVEGARDAIRKRVIELVDRRMTFIQVRQAQEILKDMGIEGFPLDLLQFKLAKIFYHILDFDRAREQAERFVAAHPGHPLSRDAGRLLKKIMDRHRVHPRTVGVLLPLTGPYRDYGRRALEGVQLGAGIFDPAAKSNADAGPVLVIRDTGSDPDKAVEQVEDLVFNEHVIAMIGPMVAKESYAAAVKAEELEVPMITLSIRKDITEVGPYVFRNFLTLQAQARVLVSYAMDKLGVRKFGLLYPNDWYGVEFTNAFWDEVNRRRGEVRAAERYEPDAKNFATPIKKMVGRYYLETRHDYIRERQRIRREISNPVQRRRALEKLVKSIKPIVDFKALFVPDYVDKVVMIAPQLAFEDVVLHTDSQYKIDRIKKSLGRDKLDMIYLLGGNGWNNPKLVEWAEKYIQGAIFCDGFFLDSQRPATRLFTGKFKANFDREPSMMEAEAHDTAAIVKSIIEKKKPASRQDFRKALLTMDRFPGATGDTRFSPGGEADKNLFLLTVDDEEIVEIETGPAADAGTG